MSKPSQPHLMCYRLLAALAALLVAGPAAAAVPGTVALEGVMLAAGGAPAADGGYVVTVAIYKDETTKTALWSEGPLKITVAGGRFGLTLGASKALDPALLAGGDANWIGVSVDSDPELPRRALHASPFALAAALADKAKAVECTGCLTAGHFANGGVPGAAVGFNYAGSATKGGPAIDVACTGCVSVGELKFDGDVDLGGHSLKAGNGTFSGDVVAKTVTATGFIGDGSKLTGLALPSGSCKDGEAVKGIAGDGTLVCAKVAGALPADGVGQVSGGLLSNTFIDAQAAPVGDVAIPDNTGADATSTIDFPDLGLAQGISVSVEVQNSDLATLRLRLLPPDDKKVGYVLCDPCGDKDAKSLKATWSDKAAPKAGDFKAWLGNNPKGSWTLIATDSSFCIKQAPGNAGLCDLDAKTDGKIVTWKVEAKTLSTKKVAATSALQLLPQADAPLPCTVNHMGSLYFDKATKALRYCDGEAWRSLADSCGNGVKEAAEECDDGNKVDNDGCNNQCKLGSYGQDKATPAVSCLELLTTFKAAGVTLKDGDYWIKAPKGQVLQVACDMSSEGGGYTYFKVDSGKTTFRSTDDNSCKDYGLDIVYPRSKAQWVWMLAKFGSTYFDTIPGVTKPGNGGNYTGCAMRHPGSYGSGCNDWRVPDGGRWWLRDASYSEPNGDYEANCWLSMYKFDANDIQFNDGTCSYKTSKYLCSTNDKK